MLYDAGNHLKEVRDSQSSVVGQYFYGGEGRRVKKISSTETTVFVYNAGGRLVAEYSTVLAQTQQVSYLTEDHLGSPRVITNESGAVTSRKDFAAFGDEVATPQRTQGLGYQPTGLRQDYTGYEKDDESGLEFAQARYYNPTHGRFTSVDPLTASATIRNPQTFNRYAYALNSPYKFTDPLGLIPSSTGACGTWCPGGDSGSFGSGGAFDSIAGMIGIDIYFVLTRTRQYTTFAEDGGRRVEIKINITERFILDRNKDIVSREGAPQVVARPKSVGSMLVSEEQITSIENIVETAVKLALAEGFPVPILLTLLRIETQYGLLENREPGQPPNKVSTINPGQYSRQPNGDRAVSISEAGGKQNALDINIRKVMSLWNGKYVQSGENLQEMFELYNSEKGKMKAYGAKAIGYYREITQSYEELNSIDGSFFVVGRPSFIPFILTPCSMFNPCPRLR